MGLSSNRIKKPETIFGYYYLSHYFSYDKDTGRITNKEISIANMPVSFKLGLDFWNKKSGCYADSSQYKSGNNQYIKIRHISELGKAVFLAHRLAWLLHYGEWPNGDVDHLDGDGTNKRMENLRDCHGTTNNMRNVHVHQKRKYPRGVRFYISGAAKTPTFRAYYHRDGDGKLITLYCGRDYFEACCARKSWENEMLKDPSNGYTARHFGRE